MISSIRAGSELRGAAVDVGEGLADLLAPDLAPGHRLLALQLRARELQRLELADPFRVLSGGAVASLLLLPLREVLLVAVFRVDESFTGVAHRSSWSPRPFPNDSAS